jgi:hypothetical protein
MHKCKLAIIIFILLYFVTVAMSEAPSIVSYQGFLTDSSGLPISGLYDILFTIYDHPTELTPPHIKWQENHNGPNQVLVENGQFTANLGTLVPLVDTVFRQTERYLGITVEDDPEIIPRVRLASSPYSLRVETVDGATGGHIFGDMDLHSTLGVGDTFGNSGRIQITDGSIITLIADGGLGTGSRLILGNSAIDTAINLYGDRGGAGYIDVRGSDGSSAVELNGLTGKVIVSKAGETGNVSLFGGASNGGTIWLNDPNELTTCSIVASQNGDDGASIILRDINNDIGIVLDAENGPQDGALIEMYDGSTITFEIDANDQDAGGAKMILSESDNGNNTIVLDAESGDEGGGRVQLRNGDQSAVTTISFDAHDGPAGGANIILKDNDGYETVEIDAENSVGARMILSTVNSNTAIQTIILNANEGSTGGGDITLSNDTGLTTIQLDADYASTGKGRVITDVLEITGGADLSEQFEIRAAQGDLFPEPGMVVCIDPIHTGKLIVSSKAYDPTVAGIISGAGGIRPGMLMGQARSISDGRHAVALTGRVYCQADAKYGPIKPGDLLTTSNTLGHAMRVGDFTKSHGTILGKAMSVLNEGTGLVLVLVTLQ